MVHPPAGRRQRWWPGLPERWRPGVEQARGTELQGWRRGAAAWRLSRKYPPCGLLHRQRRMV